MEHRPDMETAWYEPFPIYSNQIHVLIVACVTTLPTDPGELQREIDTYTKVTSGLV
jgi:hypothetical protein